ncbi:MAG: Gfo/Idh/MocA family oxidoreductase, partial [Anaerolineales bacterium]|nr:Gfo/Idh/MocA family oxidoreductase [Anaerolineales bacterium]
CADTASSDPINLAAEIARDRARVVVIGNVGMDIPRNVYYGKELDILVSRSYGPGRYDPFYEEQGQDYPIGYVRWTEGRNLSAVIDLLASGQLNVDSMITHRFPIDQGKDAYDLITGGTGEPFLAVILTYPEAEEEIGEPLRRVAFSDRPIKPESVVRVGVLGAGNFANNVMLPAMRQVDGIEFLGIASAGGLSGSQVAERFGFRYTTTEEVKLLEDENVNTIAVLTRHNLHVRQTIAALRAGKHVFCEKPLALNTADLNEILEVLEQSNRLLMVGFNRRFASLSQSLKAFMKRAHEPLVMAYRINAGYLPSSHWLHDPDQGGGRIVGEACHFIDLLTFFVDSLPVRVNCIGLPDGNRYHEDNVIIVIEFADGSIGTVTYLANGDRSLAKERIEVFGGGRAAVLDDFRTLELYSGGKRRVERSRLRQDKGHRGEWGAFAEAVTTGGPPPIPYDQLIAVTQASFAAIESLTTQRVVLLENFLKD